MAIPEADEGFGGFEEFDPVKLRIPDGLSVPCRQEDIPTTKRLRAKKAKRFVLGPIPVGWAIACAAADSNCLILGLIILMKTGSRIARPATDYTVVSEEFGRQAGLSRNQRHRAVNALEAAGLAVVERWPNRAPRVRLKAWDRETDG